MYRPRGVQQKIDRAKKHLRAIEVEVGAFKFHNRKALRYEVNAETGQKHCYVRFQYPLPFDLPLVIGEFAHNLRCVFDHLAGELVRKNGETPDEQTHFPVCKDSAAFAGAPTRKKVRGISTTAMGIIEEVQPYQPGYEGLIKLNKLNNFDKHETLSVTAAKAKEMVFFADLAELIAGGVKKSVNFLVHTHIAGDATTILCDGDLFCIIPTTEDDGESHAQVDFTCEVAFLTPEIVKFETVVTCLTELMALVERVVDKFAPVL